MSHGSTRKKTIFYLGNTGKHMEITEVIIVLLLKFFRNWVIVFWKKHTKEPCGWN